jgi:hypothetical protein
MASKRVLKAPSGSSLGLRQRGSSSSSLGEPVWLLFLQWTRTDPDCFVLSWRPLFFYSFVVALAVSNWLLIHVLLCGRCWASVWVLV